MAATSGKRFGRTVAMRACSCCRAPRSNVLRGLLHQRVLECIDGIGRRAAAVDSSGDELAERVAQFALRQFRDGGDQLMRKLAADGGTDSAIFRTGARRSSRAIRDACSVVGIESAAAVPVST